MDMPQSVGILEPLRSEIARKAVRGLRAATALCIGVLLFSGCQADSEVQDKKIALDLKTEIEATLKPGDGPDKIEQFIKQKGWLLKSYAPGYMGWVRDERLSAKSMDVRIRVDKDRRFVEATVLPGRTMSEPTPNIDPRAD
jgi:hypothetical protein